MVLPRPKLFRKRRERKNESALFNFCQSVLTFFTCFVSGGKKLSRRRRNRVNVVPVCTSQASVREVRNDEVQVDSPAENMVRSIPLVSHRQRNLVAGANIGCVATDEVERMNVEEVFSVVSVEVTSRNSVGKVKTTNGCEAIAVQGMENRKQVDKTGVVEKDDGKIDVVGKGDGKQNQITESGNGKQNRVTESGDGKECLGAEQGDCIMVDSDKDNCQGHFINVKGNGKENMVLKKDDSDVKLAEKDAVSNKKLGKGNMVVEVANTKVEVLVVNERFTEKAVSKRDSGCEECVVTTDSSNEGMNEDKKMIADESIQMVETGDRSQGRKKLSTAQEVSQSDEHEEGVGYPLCLFEENTSIAKFAKLSFVAGIVESIVFQAAESLTNREETDQGYVQSTDSNEGLHGFVEPSVGKTNLSIPNSAAKVDVHTNNAGMKELGSAATALYQSVSNVDEVADIMPATRRSSICKIDVFGNEKRCGVRNKSPIRRESNPQPCHIHLNTTYQSVSVTSSGSCSTLHTFWEDEAEFEMVACSKSKLVQEIIMQDDLHQHNNIKYENIKKEEEIEVTCLKRSMDAVEQNEKNVIDPLFKCKRSGFKWKLPTAHIMETITEDVEGELETEREVGAAEMVLVERRCDEKEEGGQEKKEHEIEKQKEKDMIDGEEYEKKEQAGVQNEVWGKEGAQEKEKAETRDGGDMIGVGKYEKEEQAGVQNGVWEKEGAQEKEKAETRDGGDMIGVGKYEKEEHAGVQNGVWGKKGAQEKEKVETQDGGDMIGGGEYEKEEQAGEQKGVREEEGAQKKEKAEKRNGGDIIGVGEYEKEEQAEVQNGVWEKEGAQEKEKAEARDGGIVITERKLGAVEDGEQGHVQTGNYEDLKKQERREIDDGKAQKFGKDHELEVDSMEQMGRNGDDVGEVGDENEQKGGESEEMGLEYAVDSFLDGEMAGKNV